MSSSNCLLQVAGLKLEDGYETAPIRFSASLYPGVTLLRCPDDRLMRGALEALASEWRYVSDPGDDLHLYWVPEITRSENNITGNDWLESQREVYTGWDTVLESELVDAFGLAEHVVKPLYMFSLGTVRKLNLIGAFASNAELAFMETPFAALDAPSRGLVAELLDEAADHPRRGWLIADFHTPAPLRGLAFRSIIQL